MKRVLFFLFTLASLAAAAERPKTFINLPWGASPEEAKRALSARPGVVFPENTDDYHMEPTGGTFAGQPVAKWILDFPDRRLASASVILKLEGGATSVYKDLRSKLAEKYGSPTTEKKLGAGKAVRPANYERRVNFGSMSTWKFTPTLKDKESITVVAELSDGKGGSTNSEDALTVVVRYTNETMLPNKGEGPGKTVAPIKKEDL